MRRTFKFIATVMLMLAVIFSVTVSASAASSGKVIYKNDFSSGELDETMWYVNGGTAAVTEEYGEQFLRCTSIVGNSRQIDVTFGPAEVKNVDVTLRIRARNSQTLAGSRMGLSFRSTTIPASQNFAYQLGFSESNMTVNLMNSHYDVQSKVIAEDYNAAIRAGLWNNIKLCLRENRIVVYMNGELVCDIEDDSYPAEGGIGICGVRYTFDVDDIVMTQYEGSTLPEPTPNETPIWAGAFGTDEKPEIADSGNERFDPFASDSENTDGTTDTADADSEKTPIGRYIVIAIIAVLVILAIGTVIIILLLIKENKKDKKEAEPPEAEPLTEDNSEKEGNE